MDRSSNVESSMSKKMLKGHVETCIVDRSKFTYLSKKMSCLSLGRFASLAPEVVKLRDTQMVLPDLQLSCHLFLFHRKQQTLVSLTPFT